MRYLLIGEAVAFLCGMAQATIILDIDPIDNSSVPGFEGYVTQDLVVTTTSDWMSAQLIITLDEPGMIYQDPEGGDNPMPGSFPTYPSLEFDTYVTDGGLGAASIIGGATDLGGGAVAVFNTDAIDIAWFTTYMDEIGILPLARITLDSSASGTWQFLATAAPPEGPQVLAGGDIVNGRLPEPMSLTILGVGALALRLRRRHAR